MRRLATLLAAATLVAVTPAVTPGAAAVAAPPAAVAGHAGTQLARFGGGFRSRGFGYGRPAYRNPRGFGAPRRGHGFLRGLFHGLFWGWLLSHFFGGGFPLILPLLLLLLAFFVLRRRRSPPSYRAG